MRPYLSNENEGKAIQAMRVVTTATQPQHNTCDKGKCKQGWWWVSLDVTPSTSAVIDNRSRYMTVASIRAPNDLQLKIWEGEGRYSTSNEVEVTSVTTKNGENRKNFLIPKTSGCSKDDKLSDRTFIFFKNAF